MLKVLSRNYTCICNQIAANPDIIPRLADELHSKEFITLDTSQAVKYTPSLIPYQRATRVMEPAIDRSAPHTVDKLIEILRKFLIEIQPP